jgi:hypothetical protein
MTVSEVISDMSTGPRTGTIHFAVRRTEADRTDAFLTIEM